MPQKDLPARLLGADREQMGRIPIDRAVAELARLGLVDRPDGRLVASGAARAFHRIMLGGW